MAVIVRCSCPSLRPNSCDISRLNPTIPAKLTGKTNISAKSNLGGLLHLSLFKILNDTEANAVLKPEERPLPSFEGKSFVIAFPKISIRPWVSHVVHHRLPRSCCIYSGSHYTRMVMWEEIYDIGKRLADYNHIINQLFAHQRLAPSGFPTAFVLATAFMLGFPFEALAETCEADTLSAINMPLLFAIAMVGATVGGQLLMDDHPTLFWTPCAAHCIDLMLHDICKLPIITRTVKRAIALNGYIYNHPYVLNMMRTFTEQKELIRPGVTRFATVFLTLQSIYNQKNKLRRMFTSKEWSTSQYHRATKGKDAYETVMSIGFWNNIQYSLRATGPLMRVLRLVDSEKKPAMGYIYEAMDRAKEAISKSFNYNEAKYYEIWEIIDKRWNDQLHRPLHAAGYYLNPEYFYTTPRIESNEELNQGFLDTMARLVPDEAIQHLVETELSLYRYARGVMGSPNAIRNRALWSPGLLARQRRGELARLNDQLRQINAALRRQAKIESYAPNLSYVPGRIPEKEVIVDSRKHQLITNLKSGKNYLRNQEPDKAFAEFKAALELAQSLGDPTEEKKAARGLGASLQRQGKHREAVKYHSMVLNISEKAGDDSGNTEAYGAIADCYTELGDLEQAGKFYDKYIARLETD